MKKKEVTGFNVWQKIGMFFYNKYLLTLTIWLVTIVFGSLSYAVWMRKEGFPSIDVPIGIVQVVSLDGSAESVDKKYVEPLFTSIKKDQNVKTVTSTANDQGASIQITYKDDTDVQASLDSIKNDVATSIPENSPVFYIKVNAGKLTPEGDDILVSVHNNDLTPKELDEKASQIASIIQSKSSLVEKVHVFNLMETVTDSATGKISTAQVRFDRFYHSDELDSIQQSVIVGVTAKEGVDQLELYDEVDAVIKSQEIKDTGASATIAADFAENIREQVTGLQRNLFEGLVVVLIVSFILISLRGSIVTALAMTTTVIATVAILNIIGFTINTITLFSLVLCLALIVDDTTIVVESIDAGLKKSGKFKDVVADSIKRVARASATGTLTTMLAFAPMLFIGGVLGEFIRAIPITIIISLLVSLVVSFTFIPLFMRISYGRRIKIGERRLSFVNKMEEGLGNTLSRVLLWSSRTKVRSLSTKLHAVLISVLFVVGGGFIFKGVEFNIFPAPKDGNSIILLGQVKDRESASIDKTQDYTDALLEKAKDIVGEDLHRISLTALGAANRDGFSATVLLTPINEREKTSVEIAKSLQSELEVLVPEMLVTAESAGVGPPEGNFTVRIKSDDAEKAGNLSADVKKFLESTTLTRIDGTTATFKEVRVTPSNLIARDFGERIVDVTAEFTAKDVSTLVTLAEDAVTEEFTPEKVQSYGLDGDALGFNFGQEEENQESFASMGRAIGPLFLAMFVLMALLFRSLTQPLLILMALPFAIFGVASGLSITNNPLSFFVMLGVFALIGISLNNTILLTDYANQAQKEGKPATEAMASAIRARLRPLLTTSITSIFALLPLALNDPFWEGLAYTLIFGLISSTILVLIVFPYFYLIEESIRFRLRKIFRRIVKLFR